MESAIPTQDERDDRIRVATRSDAGAVREIYAPFCESTAISFEETAPSVAEMENRIASTLETYPWLVCERDGEVVGYAYAGQLRKRRAYQWTVELSVYVAERARDAGVGHALYESLFAILESQGVRDAYAVTTLPNRASVRFHEKLGFERLVEFPEMGYTQDDWHDVAWWRRQLGEKDAAPKPITPFSELRDGDATDEGAVGNLILESLLRTGEQYLQ